MLFITVIFYNGVNGLVCHVRMSVLIFCNTLVKLISGIASIYVEKSMPKKLNSDLPQSKHSGTLSLSFYSLFFPIQITFVFSLFIFSPEKFPKISMVFKADCIRSAEYHQK